MVWQTIEPAEIDDPNLRLLPPFAPFHPLEFTVENESFLVVDQAQAFAAGIILISLNFTVSPFELVDDGFKYKTKTTA